MPAPVDQTCPIINEVINDIKGAIHLIDSAVNDFNELTPDDLKDILKEALYKLGALTHKHSLIEDIRDANSQLRDWGNELEGKADDLQRELDELQEQLNAA